MVFSVASVHVHSLMVIVLKEIMKLVSGKAMDAIIGRMVHGAEDITPTVSVKVQPLSSHQATVGCMKEIWRMISS